MSAGIAGTMRPVPGLNPNTPFIAAGMRIEPPASLACARGAMRLATAAAGTGDAGWVTVVGGALERWVVTSPPERCQVP
jgi:hypothetical protein